MSFSNEIRTGRHCVFKLHCHLVFVTKYRRNVFTKEVLEDLHGIFKNVCTDFESKLIEFNGEDDHVHLLIHYPPKVSISSLVNSLKGVSSRLIRKKTIQVLARNYGVMLFGLQVTLQALVVALLLRFYVNILKNKGKFIKFQIRYALYHRPKGRCFTACLITDLNMLQFHAATYAYALTMLLTR